jgi:anti-sigma factor RsiW
MDAVEKTSILCDELAELLGEYVDGDLPFSMKNRLSQHLQSCSECRNLHRNYQRTIQIASLLKDKPMPEGAKERLAEGLNKRLGLNLAFFK